MYRSVPIFKDTVNHTVEMFVYKVCALLLLLSLFVMLLLKPSSQLDFVSAYASRRGSSMGPASSTRLCCGERPIR